MPHFLKTFQNLYHQCAQYLRHTPTTFSILLKNDLPQTARRQQQTARERGDQESRDGNMQQMLFEKADMPLQRRFLTSRKLHVHHWQHSSPIRAKVS